MMSGKGFGRVRSEVADIVDSRILIGHNLVSDLQVLGIQHPQPLIRDTAYNQSLCSGRHRPLHQLVRETLGIELRPGQHDGVEEARATLAVYKSVQRQWEQAFNPPQLK